MHAQQNFFFLNRMQIMFAGDFPRLSSTQTKLFCSHFKKSGSFNQFRKSPITDKGEKISKLQD